MALTDSNPLVSIVIPVFNGSEYVQEAIESAMFQSYRNIEIIVINDGSNDHGLFEIAIVLYDEFVRIKRKDNGG